MGKRIDNRNLIEEWIIKMDANKKSYKFLWNASDFRSLEVDKYDHILGTPRTPILN
jgi:hypothetical protein